MYDNSVNDKVKVVISGVLKRVERYLKEKDMIVLDEVMLDEKISTFLMQISSDFIIKGVMPVFRKSLSFSSRSVYYDDEYVSFSFEKNTYDGYYPFVLWICIKKSAYELDENIFADRFVNFVFNRSGISSSVLREFFFKENLITYEVLRIVFRNSLEEVKVDLISDDFFGGRVCLQKPIKNRISPNKPVIYMKGNSLLVYNKEVPKSGSFIFYNTIKEGID